MSSEEKCLAPAEMLLIDPSDVSVISEDLLSYDQRSLGLSAPDSALISHSVKKVKLPPENRKQIQALSF